MPKVWKKESVKQRKRGLRGVLVAVAGDEQDEHVIQLVCNFVKGSKTPMYAVHVIEMPWSESVEGQPAEHVTLSGDAVLTRAQVAAANCGTALEPELLQARSAGAAIVDEACERGCELIVLGMPYKTRHGHFILGETIPYVLEHSPIRVWVIRAPKS